VKLTFFGLKADVQIASYLFTVFRTAMETEWAIYWASHKEEHPCHGKTVRKSFLMGMIKRLNARLSALIEAAKSGPALSESREIIVLKAQIVEKAFSRGSGRYARLGCCSTCPTRPATFGNNCAVRQGDRCAGGVLPVDPVAPKTAIFTGYTLGRRSVWQAAFVLGKKAYCPRKL
jgi:hypothetical protein